MNPALAPKPDPAMPDDRLAVLVGQGDHAAFRLLMRRHNQAMFRAARSILRDEAEAEDAVQEAYLQAFRRIGDFRGESKLSTWLVRIGVNEALGRLRRRRRTAAVISLEGDRPVEWEAAMETTHGAQAEEPEHEAMRAQTRRLLEAKIDRLPDAFRTVFVLRALEETSVEDAAAILGIAEATVRTRYFRARALLRDSLSRELDLAQDGAFRFLGDRCDRIVERVMARLSESPPGGP